MSKENGQPLTARELAKTLLDLSDLDVLVYFRVLGDNDEGEEEPTEPGEFNETPTESPTYTEYTLDPEIVEAPSRVTIFALKDEETE